jgi:hypothetical protein
MTFSKLIPVGLLAGGIGVGAVLTVPANGNLQNALNAAQPGDTITLAPGAVYRGNFTLPAKTGSSYITITTAQLNTLPPEGQRITPATASYLPKVVAPSTSSAFTSAPGAHHYILRGLEVTVSSGGYASDLLNLGSSVESDLSTYANDVIVDQCYIHGDPNVGGKRGIALNGVNIVVKNSYLSNFKSTSQDSQAIAGWYGPGPFQIVNNYLEGGQSVLFGGAAPGIPNLVPSNIQIIHNYMSRPMAWKNVWPVKNLLELKNAQNVTISNNILENNWSSWQNGFGVLFTVRTCESGNYPWAVVKNVAFTYNIVRNSDQGVNIMGTDNERSGCPAPGIAGQTSGILVQNNLFANIGMSVDGTFLQVLSGAKAITINHNTVLQGGRIVSADGTPTQGFIFENNISLFTDYGVVGTNYAQGISTLNHYFPGYVYVKNVAANAPSWVAGMYPSGNFFPSFVEYVEFVNYSYGNYQLGVNSPFKGAGTDGKDIGADITGVMNATATVASGSQTNSCNSATTC